MTLTRRQSVDVCRRGPALFVGLPGSEIDIERLSEFVIGRGLDAAIHVIDGTLEGILWIKRGAPGEAWFLEADGGETIVPIEPERELLRDIAASGTVSCYVCAPDGARAGLEPSIDRRDARRRSSPSSGGIVAPGTGIADETVPRILRNSRVAAADRAREVDRTPLSAPEPHAAPTVPNDDAIAVPKGGSDIAASSLEHVPVVATSAPSATATDPEAAFPDTAQAVEAPATRPWPAILVEVRARVAKQRGKRLAERFVEALGAALEAYGGRIDGDLVVAPPLSDQQWTAIVAAGCVPVTVVAGRAWTDRALETAERTVFVREGSA
jgi:hypothetical protein